MKFRPFLILPILSLTISIVIVSQQYIRKVSIVKSLTAVTAEYNQLEPVYISLVKKQSSK